jgi:hypothetical protein
MKRQATRRALALLLAGVYALSLSGSLLHRILVEHVRCADHGDLVHAIPGEHDHGPFSVDPIAPPALSAGDGPIDEHLDGHAHEHCAAAAFAAMGAASVGRVLIEQPAPRPLLVEVGAPPRAGHLTWTERERFRLAPKGSPPA